MEDHRLIIEDFEGLWNDYEDNDDCWKILKDYEGLLKDYDDCWKILKDFD